MSHAQGSFALPSRPVHADATESTRVAQMASLSHALGRLRSRNSQSQLRPISLPGSTRYCAHFEFQMSPTASSSSKAPSGPPAKVVAGSRRPLSSASASKSIKTDAPKASGSKKGVNASKPVVDAAGPEDTSESDGVSTKNPTKRVIGKDSKTTGKGSKASGKAPKATTDASDTGDESSEDGEEEAIGKELDVLANLYHIPETTDQYNNPDLYEEIPLPPIKPSNRKVWDPKKSTCVLDTGHFPFLTSSSEDPWRKYFPGEAERLGTKNGLARKSLPPSFCVNSFPNVKSPAPHHPFKIVKHKTSGVITRLVHPLGKEYLRPRIILYHRMKYDTDRSVEGMDPEVVKHLSEMSSNSWRVDFSTGYLSRWGDEGVNWDLYGDYNTAKGVRLCFFILFIYR